MKISEIRNMKDDELQNELGRLRRHVFDLRSQSVTEKVEDPSMLTKARRDIARILTVIHEREQQAAEQAS
jgi:large subunit ribosomal protein L29